MEITKKEIKEILDKRQAYLSGLCENNSTSFDDIQYIFGYAACLKNIAKDLGHKKSYGHTLK